MNISSLSSSQLRKQIVDPNNLNDNLICVVCNELVWDPKECSQCQHLFCSKCIKKWLKEKQICPFKCTEEIQLNEPHRIYRNQISEIQVKCLNKGCPQQMQLQNLDSHLKQCEYVETICPYPDCLFKDSFKEIQVHQITCENRTQNCQKCQETYKVKNIHDCLDIVIKKVKIQEDQIKELINRLDYFEENYIMQESKMKVQKRNSRK